MKKIIYSNLCDRYEGEYACGWSLIKERLVDFFQGSSWLLRGTASIWRGKLEAGCVFSDFEQILNTVLKDCEYLEIYEDGGHFFIKCSHHDGENYYEIKGITDAGLKYIENWECTWNDPRSEIYIHDMVMKRYSFLPRFTKFHKNAV